MQKCFFGVPMFNIFKSNYRENTDAVRYAESSMRNGFGLKFIHKFFNLPYLQLQRAALMKQLETNQSESEICQQELDLYAESDEADYDLWVLFMILSLLLFKMQLV